MLFNFFFAVGLLVAFCIGMTLLLIALGKIKV